jgi:alpha-glucosidase
MAKGTKKFWTAARHAAQVIPPKGRNLKNVFRGQLLYESCEIDCVTVFRVTVVPINGTPPKSHALDPTVSLSWRRIRRLPEQCPLRWVQESESRWSFQWSLASGEQCLGLGERYGGLNLRGRTHTLFATDDERHLESTDSLYKSIPMLVVLGRNGANGLFLDSPAAQVWDLDVARENLASIRLLSRRGFTLYWFSRAPLPKLIAAFTKLTGRCPLPPRWSLGHQQSRWSYPSEQVVRGIAQQFRARKIPCDTLVLDIDYMDDYRVFTVSRERFPHFESLIGELSRDGFRVVTIVDPAVKHSLRDATYREGKALDAFCTQFDGSTFVGQVWPGPSCLPDFMRGEVRSWWGNKLDFLLSRGVAGIWNDMNEPALFGNQRPFNPQSEELPRNQHQLFMQEADNETVGHFEVRNLYGQQMARATYEGFRSSRPDQRHFMLTRSGFAGIQRYAAVWLGDNTSWFEHLRLSIPMLLNISLSGVAFCGADIGGFGGNTDAELLVRWYQLGIFYPFCRNHCALNGRPQEPWALGAEAESAIRHLLGVRYKLIPYLERLFVEHRECGAPLMRPMVWHYPDDSSAHQLDDQFMLGSDLLVAPIVHRGRTRRPVYFPKGDWFRFDDNAKVKGGRYHEVEYGVANAPVFVRSGAILPLAGPVQHTGELDSAPIAFRCYGNRARGRYWQDDGSSLGYERGEFNDWSLKFEHGRFEARCKHQGYTARARRYCFETMDQQISLKNWPTAGTDRYPL